MSVFTCTHTLTHTHTHIYKESFGSFQGYLYKDCHFGLSIVALVILASWGGKNMSWLKEITFQIMREKKERE